jgi:hypothetical protein
MDPLEVSLEFCASCEKLRMSNPVFQLYFCPRLEALAFRRTSERIWQIYTVFSIEGMNSFIAKVENYFDTKLFSPKGWA